MNFPTINTQAFVPICVNHPVEDLVLSYMIDTYIHTDIRSYVALFSLVVPALPYHERLAFCL